VVTTTKEDNRNLDNSPYTAVLLPNQLRLAVVGGGGGAWGSLLRLSLLLVDRTVSASGRLVTFVAVTSLRR
jgi:hypothetical protein